MSIKMLAAALILCTIPAMANAWTLTTQASSAGGSISSVTKTSGPQISTDGPLSKSGLTGPTPVAFSAADGYFVSKIVKIVVTDEGSTTTAIPISTASPINVVPENPATEDVMIQVTFRADAANVLNKATATAGSGGTVAPSSISYITYTENNIKKLAIPLVFKFTPALGSKVTGIASPSGYTVADLTPWTSPTNFFTAGGAKVNRVVTVTIPAGTVITGGIRLAGEFGATAQPIARAGASQTVAVGSRVQLDGSASTGGSFSAWRLIASPTWNLEMFRANPERYPIPAGFSSTLASFTTPVLTLPAGSTEGTYLFEYRIADASAATGQRTASVVQVTVVAGTNPIVASVNNCITCHNSIGIGQSGQPPKNVVNDAWTASQHKTAGVACYTCHVGTNSGGHPGLLTGGSVSESTFNYQSPYGSGNFCVTCHNPAIITEFEASKHSVRAGTSSCSFCHVQGVHNPIAACIDCHTPDNPPYGLSWPPAGLDFHNDYTNDTNVCTNCHNLHNPATVTGMTGAPHYNNITSVGYPASYVTSKVACTDCHASNALNKTVRYQWDRSGHAAYTDPAWTAYDFKTRSGCVQCHTTTGFIAYSTGKVTAAWGVAADKTKEVLACNGCHSDVANGVVRTVTPIKPFADDSYVNRNVGPSNICMNCHSGRNNGLSITSANFASQSFIAPHYLAAGGTLHGKGGYNFPDQTYAFYSSNSHRTIGMGNSYNTGTEGPCIGCHMSAAQKHLFKAVSTATTGAISQVTSPACAKCHGAALNDTLLLNDRKTNFSNALQVLNQTLTYRGFVYSPAYPYFTNTDWTYFNAANTMGAAFNYVLLLKEPGAYAHNPAYAKQLAFDSIDFLYNGTITGSITSAVTGLLSAGTITQSQADSLNAYQNTNSCTVCHGYPPATIQHSGAAHPNSTNCSACHNTDPAVHRNGIVDVSTNCNGCHGYPPDYTNGTPKANSHTASGHLVGCNTCHSGTTANGTTITNTALHMNGSYNLQAGNSATFSYSFASTGGTCSGISCHNGSTATWGGLVDCSSCHGNDSASANPMASGKHGAHMNNDATLGAANNFSCTTCHASTVSSNQTIGNPANHGNGLKNYSGVTAGKITVANSGRCSSNYCHSTGQRADVAIFWNMTAANWYSNRTLDCSGCHGGGTGTGYPNYVSGAAGSATANSHAKHVTTLLITNTTGCATCHVKTVDLGTVNKLRNYSSAHLNKTIDVTMQSAYGGTFGGTAGNKTCTNVYCHSNGNSGAALKTAQWGDTLTCSGCHGGDSTSSTPIATGKHGAHINNAAILGSNFACAECHAKTVSLASNTMITNPVMHVNTFKDYSGLKAGKNSSYNSTTGVCSATYCHSDGKGIAKSMTTDNWKASTTLDCTGCHGSDAASAFSSVAGEPNYVNSGAGTARANSHQKHAAAGIASCDACHTGTTTSGTAIKAGSLLHADGSINVTFNSAKAGAGVTWAAASKTCSNISCHSGSSAQWGATLTCDACHGGDSTSSTPIVSGKHGAHINNAGILGSNFACAECHAKTVSLASNTVITNPAQHANGFKDYSGLKAGKSSSYDTTTGVCSTAYCHSDGKGIAKSMTTDNWKASTTLDCTGCHGSDAASAFSSVAGEPNYVNSGAGTARANSHQKHAAAGIASCDACHTGTTTSGTAIKAGSLLHADGSINVTFNSAKAGAGVTWAAASKTCSNISCHGGTNATWGSTLGCATCHGTPPSYTNGDPKTNSHGSHSYSCGTCHNGTTTDGTSIANPALHGNGVYDVTSDSGHSFTYTYAAAGGSCNNISCHGGTNATWGSTLGCATCHGTPPSYTNGSPKANSHVSHNYGCGTCHNDTTADGSTIANPALHGNGVYNVTSDSGHSFTYTFAATGGSCNNISCHGGTSATWGRSANHNATLQVGGDVLVFINGNQDHSAGFTTQLDCITCHYENIVTQHNGKCAVCHSGATPPANALIGNWDRSCTACHPVIHGNMGPDHNGVYTGSSASCSKCHDDSGEFPGPANKCTDCHNQASIAASVVVP